MSLVTEHYRPILSSTRFAEVCTRLAEVFNQWRIWLTEVKTVCSPLRALSDQIFSSQSLNKLSLVTEHYYPTNSSTRFAEVCTRFAEVFG